MSNVVSCPSLKLSPRRTIIHILQRIVVSIEPLLSVLSGSVVVIYTIPLTSRAASALRLSAFIIKHITLISNMIQLLAF